MYWYHLQPKSHKKNNPEKKPSSRDKTPHLVPPTQLGLQAMHYTVDPCRLKNLDGDMLPSPKCEVHSVEVEVIPQGQIWWRHTNQRMTMLHHWWVQFWRSFTTTKRLTNFEGRFYNFYKKQPQMITVTEVQDNITCFDRVSAGREVSWKIILHNTVCGKLG